MWGSLQLIHPNYHTKERYDITKYNSRQAYHVFWKFLKSLMEFHSILKEEVVSYLTWPGHSPLESSLFPEYPYTSPCAPPWRNRRKGGWVYIVLLIFWYKPKYHIKFCKEKIFTNLKLSLYGIARVHAVQNQCGARSLLPLK